MITKAINKNYAGQIAGLFCEGSALLGLCKMNVKNRIIQNFTDQIFEDHFLSNLDTSIFRTVTGSFKFSSPGYMKFVMNQKDIVTGKIKTGSLDGIPVSKVGNWEWIIGHLNAYYNSVAPNLRAYHLGVVNDKLIWRIDGVSVPYGIVFIPGSVGGNGGGTSEGCPAGFIMFGGNCIEQSYGGEGGIYIKPPAETDPPLLIPEEIPKPGFDMQKLLIPIAVGLALTFLT